MESRVIQSFLLLASLESCFFKKFQAYSIGLMSGELPDHSKIWMLLLLKNFVTIFDS